VRQVFFNALFGQFAHQLLATINSTQKPVDRSLTYKLFGYNVSDEPEEFWTPDKLAVFPARKLGTDDESLLKGRITVAPETRRVLGEPDGKGRVARIDCGCRGRNLAPYLFEPKKRCQRDAQRNGSAAQRA
jgi:hypothetical protein